MREIFGESVMPYDAALITRRAVKRAIAVNDCTPNNRWSMVELWAANYLTEQCEAQEALTGYQATTSAPEPTIPNADALAEQMRALIDCDHHVEQETAVEILTVALRALGYDEAVDLYELVEDWAE